MWAHPAARRSDRTGHGGVGGEYVGAAGRR
jgi:hypothetical protein